MEEKELMDPIQVWIDELDQAVRQARADGLPDDEPFLFSDVLPRLKDLAKLILDGPIDYEPSEEEKNPQFCEIKITTAANLRTALMSHTEDPLLFACMCQLEADLEGVDHEEIADRFEEARSLMMADGGEGEETDGSGQTE